jgi:hypothetical protein
MWEYTNFYGGSTYTSSASEQMIAFLNEKKVTEWKIIRANGTYIEIAYRV